MGKSRKKQNTKFNVISSKSDGWAGDNFKISYEDVYELDNFKGAKLYGYIIEAYDNDPRWKQSLSKGVIMDQYGKNGVKRIENKLLEIKINRSDDRVYAKKLYKNEKGDYLAYFDKDCNHTSIKRIAKSAKEFEIISVDDYHLDDPNAIDITGGSASFEGDFY